MNSDCTKDDILKALKKFDEEMRDDDSWRGWESNEKFKWAIDYEGKRYPVKETIRLATGRPSPTGGKPSNTVVERLGFKVIRLRKGAKVTEKNSFWIFQANPKHFDLPSALGKLDEIAFAANQKLSLMKIGDTVFFWESGSKGGLLGTGKIISGPRMMNNPEKEKPFFKGSQLPDEALMVIIEVDNVLDERISRSDLLVHPILKNLAFFKMSQGTNFQLTQAEGYSLFAAIGGHTNPDIYKVIPGAGNKFWNDCLEGEFICVGWAKVGGLSEYREKNDFRAYYDSIVSHETPSKQELQANMLWTFRSLSPGDILVASSGGKTLLGIGIVQESGYQFIDARPEYKHTVAVAWDTSYAKKFSKTAFNRLPITKFDKQRFQEMISDKVLPPPPPPNGVFADLMASLLEEGFFFSEEVVANYLLAMQTKRFVIFTGISGTGKTQLAMQVAKHFEPKIRRAIPVEVPDDAVEMEVKPYMVNYKRLVVPSSIARTLSIPPFIQDTGPRRIDVLTAKGVFSVTIYTDQSRPGLLELLFSRESRAWFLDTFSLGDRFILRAIEPEADGEQDRLEISIPKTEEQEELLDNSLIVAVKPDWTDNRGMLGYYNPLTEQYISTSLIDFVLRAQENPDHPFFLILDEMNLARVEHYFSDFLSCLESGQPIHLHDDRDIEAGEDKEGKVIPKDLFIPDNLFITGTVNVDETTYMFSPKVLDRAFTIELSEVDFVAAAAGHGVRTSDGGLNLARMEEVIRWERKPHSGDWKNLSEIDDSFTSNLARLNTVLEKYNRHFGYRVAWEIARFVCLANEQCPSEGNALGEAMDLAILQKVLPKFHGTQGELEAVLLDLFAFCIVGSTAFLYTAKNLIPESWVIEDGVIILKETREGDATGDEPTYVRSATKLWRMLDRLKRQGFTSFID